MATFVKYSQFLWTVVISFLVIILTACQSLPTSPNISPQKASQNLQSFDLIQQISGAQNPQPSQFSGYFPILTSGDAFASRSLLAEMSKKSIDVQYYIWHNDTAGQLMLKDLYQSAQRGVKVRLLLDDLTTNPALDQLLLAFANHPNIEVKLINPKNIRLLKPVNFISAFPRYHRRMHNKSMTFDGQLSIIGGRNIGNEYLRSDTDDEFSDVDVLLAGKVVQKIEQSFENYWQSQLSYEIESLVKPAKYSLLNYINEQKLINIDPFLQGLATINKDKNSKDLFGYNPNTHIDDLIYHKNVPFRWAKIDFFVDDVAKLSKDDQKSQRLVHQLREILGTPKHQFTIVSSYFVPTKLGIQQLSKLSQDGVKVQILTNSYDSTDVPIVHSGYSETRLKLLQAGVDLYELKTDADPDLPLKKRHLRSNQISTSLHTKAFAVDDKATFIGSYNLDPRSANINTELGVLIYDKELTLGVHQMFHQGMLDISYQLSLTEDNRVVWRTFDNEKQKPVNHAKEPNQSLVSAIWVKIFSMLPIEWLL